MLKIFFYSLGFGLSVSVGLLACSPSFIQPIPDRLGPGDLSDLENPNKWIEWAKKHLAEKNETAAKHWLRKTCDETMHPELHTEAADLLLKLSSVEVEDLSRCRSLYEKAGKAGKASAYVSLARTYLDDRWVRDENLAKQLLTKAAEDLDDAQASFELASLLESGEGAVARQRAREYLVKAARKGHKDARKALARTSDGLLILAEMYEKGEGSSPDRRLAADHYVKAANQDEVKALEWLKANIANSDNAVALAVDVLAEADVKIAIASHFEDKEPERSLSLYRQLLKTSPGVAFDGVKRAVSHLSGTEGEKAVLIYAELADEGVEPAVKELERLGTSGNNGACMALGAYLEHKSRASQAADWYRKSVARDFPPAMVALASLLERGSLSTDGGEGASLEAGRLYVKAAQLGDAEAQFRLAVWLRKGTQALGRIESIANVWFRKAASQNHQEAIAEVDKLDSVSKGLGSEVWSRTEDGASAFNFSQDGAHVFTATKDCSLTRLGILLGEKGSILDENKVPNISIYQKNGSSFSGYFTLSLMRMGQLVRNSRLDGDIVSLQVIPTKSGFPALVAGPVALLTDILGTVELVHPWGAARAIQDPVRPGFIMFEPTDGSHPLTLKVERVLEPESRATRFVVIHRDSERFILNGTPVKSFEEKSNGTLLILDSNNGLALISPSAFVYAVGRFSDISLNPRSALLAGASLNGGIAVSPVPARGNSQDNFKGTDADPQVMSIDLYATDIPGSWDGVPGNGVPKELGKFLLGEISALSRTRFTAVAFSHDGTRLAAASSDRTVYIWDFEKRKLLGAVATHSSKVTELRFSPVNREVLAGLGQDGTLKVWEVREN
jgi:TPR repeat protein